MADIKLSGGEKLMSALAKIAEGMGGGRVDIGFKAGAAYPDGTPVAAVAFWNEFGDPSRNRPPRPFFRQMIAKESPDWPSKMSKLAKATGYDGAQVLGMMGADVAGALTQSINEFTTPGLAMSTILARAARYKKGEVIGPTIAKPLIDTKVMLDNITSTVEME